MEALASRRAITQEEESANILAELASILAESPLSDKGLISALRDGAGALRLDVVRNLFPPSLQARGVGEGLKGYE
jgi:hypothetical protein